jgi:DNA-binding NarL/FixJ family response regulator
MLSPCSHISTEHHAIFLPSPACERDFFLPFVLCHLDRPPRRKLFVIMTTEFLASRRVRRMRRAFISRGHQKKEGLPMRFAVFNPDAERREGLKALLRQIDRRARFNDAPDWRSAERAMQRFTPDLFVLDWHAGIRAGELRTFANRHRSLPIAAIVDAEAPSPAVRDLLAEGARGIIRRTTDSILIVKLLELILLGGNHLPADVLATPWPSPQPAQPPARSETPRPRRLVVHLSPRQEQILRYVHMGNTNKMIARALGISEGTVKIHLTSIFQQLGAPNRAAAVAIYNGLLSNQLEVLRAQLECTPRPVYGEHGPVPLRSRVAEPFRHPLLTGDTAPPLAMAAEPDYPWGETGLAQCSEPRTNDSDSADDAPQGPPGAHVLSSNE